MGRYFCAIISRKSQRLLALLFLSVSGLGSIAFAQAQTAPVNAPNFEIGRLDNNGSCSGVILVSPDGRMLYAGLRRGDIAVWDIAQRKKVQTLSQGGQDISALALSPDGTFLVSGTWDGVVSKWDLPSGRKVWSITQEHAAPLPSSRSSKILSLAVSPDNQTVLAAPLQSAVQIIDAQTGASTESPLGTRHVAVGFLDSTHGVAGKDNYGGPGGSQPEITVWELQTGKVVASLEGQAEDAIKVESTGKWLISRYGGMVRLWRVSDIQRAINAGSITKIQGFVIDSTILGAHAYQQVPFDRWTFAGAPLGRQPDPPNKVRGVELFQLPDPISILAHDIAPDGRTAFISRNDGTVRILDLGLSNQKSAWIGATGLLSASADGRFLFRSTGGSFWNAETLEMGDQPAADGAWTKSQPEFQAFATAGSDLFGFRLSLARSTGGAYSVSPPQPVLLRTELRTGKSVSLPLRARPVTVATDRNSQFLLLGYSRMLYLGYATQPVANPTPPAGDNASSSLQLYDRDLNPVGKGFGVHQSIGVERAAFSWDSRMLATFGSDNAMRVFEVESEREITSTPLKCTDASDFALTSEGVLLIIRHGGRIQCYDARTVSLLGEMTSAYPDGIAGGAVSPNGKLLATLGQEGAVKLWSIPSLNYLGRFAGIERSNDKGSVVFLSDDRIAAASRSGPAHVMKVKDATR